MASSNVINKEEKNSLFIFLAVLADHKTSRKRTFIYYIETMSFSRARCQMCLAVWLFQEANLPTGLLRALLSSCRFSHVCDWPVKQGYLVLICQLP